MPALVVAMWPIATISRIVRSSLLEVLKQDYIILARSKGLHQRTILYKHALKNSMIPTITAIGYCVGYLLTGSVMVEAVFSWPGLGRWAAHAIESVDVAAIVGFTMLTAFIFVITNLLVDVLYAWFDPRVRY
jgi:peptide/nickel transport system permease protein